MDCNINLKINKKEAVKSIEKKILFLQDITEVKEIKKVLPQLYSELSSIFTSKEIINKLEVKMMYQDNMYSKERTKENVLFMKEKVLEYLNEILLTIQDESDENDTLTEENAIIILKRILSNFYKHIEVMYEAPVHGTAGITSDMLSKIKIVNEYDVQRILYSLIKPVFPNARVEVSNDTGFSTIRYDILIDTYSMVIEVKCSRKSMTPKKLTEEIGADIFHYKYKNIFFFVYDKEKIIRDTHAFNKTYNGMFGNKNITTVIIQTVSL